MPEPTLIILTVLLPIEHDGKRYAPGDTLELAEDKAAPLIAAGVAEEAAQAQEAEAAQEPAKDAKTAKGGAKTGA